MKIVLAVRKKARPLLYTKMTPGSSPVPLKVLTKPFSQSADIADTGFRLS